MGNVCCGEDDDGPITMDPEAVMKPGNPLEITAEYDREGLDLEKVSWSRVIVVKGKDKTEDIFGKEVKKPVCTVKVSGNKVTLSYAKGKLAPKDSGNYTLTIVDEGETHTKTIKVIVEDPKRTKKIKAMFGEIDKDKSGEITNEELATALKKVNSDLADEDIQMMIKESDVDGDGKVSYEEFDNFMRRAGL